MRLLRALRGTRSQDGGASRILIGAAADGERFELRKQHLLRTDWGANSRHGQLAICDGFELDAAFDAEVVDLLLHGYELDGGLEPDEISLLGANGSYDISDVSRELSLPSWAPQQRRRITPATARKLAAVGGMLLRQLPPRGTRLLLQVPDAGGIPRFIQAGSNRPIWQTLSSRWRSEWLNVTKHLVTGRAPNAPHLLCDVVLPDTPGPIVALDLLAYDWRDVRPMDAAQRLALLEQGLGELGLIKPVIVPLSRIKNPSQHTFARLCLIKTDAPYHSRLLLSAEG